MSPNSLIPTRTIIGSTGILGWLNSSNIPYSGHVSAGRYPITMNTSETLILSIACSGGYHSVILTPEGAAAETNHDFIQTQVMNALGARESNCEKALQSIDLARLSLERLTRSITWPISLKAIRFQGEGKIVLTRQAIAECISPVSLAVREGLDPEVAKQAWEYYRNLLSEDYDGNITNPLLIKIDLLKDYLSSGWSIKESRNLWSCGISPVMARIARLFGVDEVSRIIKMISSGWNDEYALSCEKVLPEAIEAGLPWKTWKTMPWPGKLSLETLSTGDFNLIKAEYLIKTNFS